MKDIIHFSHANGFPASTYRAMFAELADEYEIRSIECIGHDPRFPVMRDWPYLVDQLIDDMARYRERADGEHPAVWLVGHSLGGYLLLMAALKRPQWVKGVVMLDSPVIAGWKSGLLRVTQRTGLDERLSPAAATRKRRTHWGQSRRGVAAFSRKAGVRALGRTDVVRLSSTSGCARRMRAAGARSRSTGTSNI